jgi:hypothetical protein
MKDTFPMSKDALEILGEELAKLEAEQAADMNRLFFPNGRQAAWDRINDFCGLNPTALGLAPKTKR